MAARSEDHLDITLPTPAISQTLPISGPAFARPDPELIKQLDEKPIWRDAGHLTSRGAVPYSEWLAGRLAESGVLKK